MPSDRCKGRDARALARPPTSRRLLPRLCRAASAALALSLALPPAALAQTPKNAAAANRHLAAGAAAAKRKDFEAALREYELAAEASPSAAASLGVAEARFQLGQLAAAHGAFKALLTSPPPGLVPAQRAQVEARLEELEKKTGLLDVTVNEPGASIAVDGKEIGKSPLSTPFRLEAGPRTLRITKPGFPAHESAVEVRGGETARAEVELRKAEEKKTGSLVIREKSGKPIRVRVDGIDVGPAPRIEELPAGTYEIGGGSGELAAVPRTVTVTPGARIEVELDARPRRARLEVRVADGRGTIELDGKKVGEGSFSGELTPGTHRLVVREPGFEVYEKELVLGENAVASESVSLARSAGIAKAEAATLGSLAGDGLYGGFLLQGTLEPGGSGHSLEDSCASLGASRCDAGSPLGAGLGGYLGYMFSPVGLELFLLGGGDLTESTAEFDGQTGSAVNPLVASPARTEVFTIGRFGGGAAVRARVAFFATRWLRLGGAVGVGGAYRVMLLGRDATTPDGFEGKYASGGVGYASFAGSAELSAGFMLGPKTAVTLGAQLWLESADPPARSEPDGDERLVKEGAGTRPIATPAYDLANGPQVFVGPFLGMHFGP